MTFESHNPATDELIGTYPEHDQAETNVRLQRAWDGWLRWSRTPLHERRAFLIRLADLLDARAETYGRLSTAEMGKPLPDAIAEIRKSARDARHKAEAGEAYLRPQPIPGVSAQITYESFGPIFSVQPWNLPFWQALRFFNTAALVGNTAIVKHAETVQGCAAALEAVVRDAGGPDGLYVNLAIPVEACAAVIADPCVRAATVTGSVRAGRGCGWQAEAQRTRIQGKCGRRGVSATASSWRHSSKLTKRAFASASGPCSRPMASSCTFRIGYVVHTE